MIRRSSPAAFGLLALFVVAVLSVDQFFEAVGQAQCPPDSFASAKLYRDLTGFSAWIASGILLVMLASRFAPEGSLPGSRLRIDPRFGGAAIALLLGIAFSSATCVYCLGGGGIAWRVAPWAPMQHAAWRDVSQVETYCSWYAGRRSGWETSYVLRLPHRSFDLVEIPGFDAFYPIVAAHLHGGGFEFDSRQVASDCGSARAPLLRTPP